MKSRKKFATLLISSTLIFVVPFAPPTMAGRGDDDPEGPFKNGDQQPQNEKRSCTEYRLSSTGGDAGFRTLNNPKDFRQVSNGSVTGQICTGGLVTIELSKRHPDTLVSLTILGREYVFGQGDRGDKLASNWFRRYFNLDLPKTSAQQGDAYLASYAYQGQPNQSQSSHKQHKYSDNYLSSLSNQSYGHGHKNQPEKYHHDLGHHQHYQLEPVYQRQDDQYGATHSTKKRKFHKISKQHRKAHKSEKSHHHHGQYIAYL